MDIASPPSEAFAAILLAGGEGSRAALGHPKQQAMLGGKALLRWSYDAFASHPALTALALVGDTASQGLVADTHHLRRAHAGSSRRASVSSGLAALTDLDDDSIVLVHDSARPGLSHVIIDQLIGAIRGGAFAAMPVLPVADTLVVTDDAIAGDVVDRSRLARVQTPQAFRLGALRAAHASWSGTEPTDDAQMVRALGHEIATVAGDPKLHKLTWAEDLAIIAALTGAEKMSTRRTAVGLGYDVHRLVAGKPLWLCGVEILHSHGLSGHSDADVALHAITDALLGALAEGDIGQHFPPSDPQWRGAASHRFVAFAVDRVAARGGTILHVDVTIVAEAPKVGPHREVMRASLAAMLALPLERVSVKATTTEGLGFAGRREGIAAQAVATLDLPA